jgi:hypothetical protein
MMQQQTPTQPEQRAGTRPLVHPKRRDIFLHGAKTFKLISALVTDPRIPLWRKAFFFGSIAALLVVLLFPDAINEALLSTALPLVGSVVGVPLDAGFDWVTFALVVVSLLRFFPAPLVAEHYNRIFRHY